MKKFIFFCFCLFHIIASAQNEVNFVLKENGEYYTEGESQNFQIVQFEGKSAEEIYTILLTNINSIYNDPKIIVSNVKNSSIKVRALLKEALFVNLYGMAECWVAANYQLEFRIKDGRVRVSAPFIEDELIRENLSSYESSHTNKSSNSNTGFWSFRKQVSKQFKKGVVKNKYQRYHKEANQRINNIINNILSNNIDDNW